MTDEFKDYEKTETNTAIAITLSLSCVSAPITRTLLFRQNIEESNSYTPEFLQSEYTLLLPTPLWAGLEINMFLETAIEVVDYDLFNNKVHFSISGSNLFEVETSAVTGNAKLFRAILKTTQQIVKMTEDIDLVLTATVK